MKVNRLSEILSVLDISHKTICDNTNIDEGDLYKLLSTKGNYDELIVRKVSNFLCIPPELLILPSDNQRMDNDNDLLLLPVFTSFVKPFYIFKLFALAEIENRSLRNILSFVPDGFTCTFSVMERFIYFSNMVVNQSFIIEDEISLESGLLKDYNIDLQKGSIIVIKVEVD